MTRNPPQTLKITARSYNAHVTDMGPLKQQELAVLVSIMVAGKNIGEFDKLTAIHQLTKQLSIFILKIQGDKPICQYFPYHIIALYTISPLNL